jgi:hypothetical protein
MWCISASLINGTRCTCEIKSRISLAKVAFKKKKEEEEKKKKKLFSTAKLELNLRKKNSEMLRLVHNCVWC